MTIDEAIYCCKSYLPEASDDHCMKCKYYGINDDGTCEASEGHRMAIDALTFIKLRREIK